MAGGLGRHRSATAALVAWAAVAATGCVLAVNWNALRRGQPEPEALEGSDASEEASGSPSELDARVPPVEDSSVGSVITDAAPDSATTTDAGTCMPDPTVGCDSDPAYSGFSCTGDAQPPSSFAVSCVQTGGAAMTYCCKGNWCGDPTGNACSTCIVEYCAAPDCLCANLGPALDDAGDTACWDYTGCVSECPDSLSACETECSGTYGGQAVAVGNADIQCMQQYCGGPCGF